MLLKFHLFIFFVTCTVSVTTLYNDHNFNATTKSPDYALKNVSNFQSRIVGGYIPQRNRFPFVAYIQIFSRHTNCTPCTGSIIASRYVITALNCLTKAIVPFGMTLEELKNRMIVNVGSMYKENARTYNVVAYYPYKTQEDKTEDFVILKLDRELNGTIAPAVLGRWQPTIGEVLTIAGHGLYNPTRSSRMLDRYVIANVKVVKTITLRQITVGFCAKGAKGERTDKGDNGGPALKSVNRQYIQVGMVANGRRINDNLDAVCKDGMFILIGPYCDFIYEKTEGAARCQQVIN